MPFKLQPAGLRALWADYRSHCDGNVATKLYRGKLVEVPKKIIYSLEGFCLFGGVTEEDLRKYEKNKNYRAVIKQMKFEAMCRKLDALINGEGCTRGLLFDLKINHGMDGKRPRDADDWNITLKIDDDEQQRTARRPEKHEERVCALAAVRPATGGEACEDEREEEHGEKPGEEPGEGQSEERGEGRIESPAIEAVVRGGPSAVAGTELVFGPSAGELIALDGSGNNGAGAGEECLPPENIYEWKGRPRRVMWRF